MRGVDRPPRAISSWALLCAALVAIAGCSSGAKTPEEAYARFSKAVTAGDGGALFDACDKTTRWNWMTVQKWHREAYDIVISNYPQGPERDRELHRFEKGATASSARELFKAEMAAAVLPQLAKLVVPGKPTIEIQAPGDIAEVVLPDGGRVRFARGEHARRPGFAGFTPDAEARKTRAYHDPEQVVRQRRRSAHGAAAPPGALMAARVGDKKARTTRRTTRGTRTMPRACWFSFRVRAAARAAEREDRRGHSGAGGGSTRQQRGGRQDAEEMELAPISKGMATAAGRGPVAASTTRRRRGTGGACAGGTAKRCRYRRHRRRRASSRCRS